MIWRLKSRSSYSVIIAVCLIQQLASGAEVDYLKDIKPILTSRCVACHGALKQKSRLRLDTAALLRKGGASGESIVPGKSAESLLLDHVRGENGAARMPPEGEPLTVAQIELLRRWIDEGAKAPDEAIPSDPTRHWSYLLPVKAEAGTGHPVDAFVTAELNRRGITPLEEAPRPILLRRLSLDLIGLPPTPAQLQAFIDDTSPQAYEKVVDELLASPQYGVRWGRHWMDVWRYSDWDGYGAEVRESQPHIWRWRDWIIESLNADKPYSNMVVEMLAGDELAPADPQTLRATGFLARNWYLFNRNVWLDNTVEHTSKAFLGTTLNCCRCHDHMYDPLPQTDYYRVRAVFEPHGIRVDPVAGQADIKKDGLVRAYDFQLETPTYLFHRGEEKEPVKEQPLAARAPGILSAHGSSELSAQPPELAAAPVALPPEVYYPGLQPAARERELAVAQTELAAAAKAHATASATLAAARQRAAEYALGQLPEPATPVVFLSDDFRAARPDLWTTGAGQWEYANGRLLQKESRDSNCELVANVVPPTDFRVAFRFKTTGGKQWKSLGISFDQASSADYDTVYLSAYADGPKIQISHHRAGQSNYPAQGAKALPVELNREYELQLAVKGQLVNVFVDGQLQLVYALPEPRRQGGKLAFWAFDATAEFLKVTAEALPAETTLATAVGQVTAAGVPQSLAEMAAAVVKAEADVALTAAGNDVAKANVSSVQARLAADAARFAQPQAADAQGLMLAAASAHRELRRQRSLRDSLQAEQKLATLTSAGGDQAEAKKAMAEADAAQKKARMELEAIKAESPAGTEYPLFGPVYPATSTGRRLAFARWITARDNPLAARVAINHMWLRHFGQPLVMSVFDFGLNGKAPTHPALLDWLAVELMDNGWRMKPIHRLLVTSAAYRRSSSSGAAQVAQRTADPENVTLWRANVRRMEAEVVRDSTLAVCGSLDLTSSGPDLDPEQGVAVTRRSVYFRSAKEKRMTFLSLFDSANVVECYRRTESIVPQQALALANSPLSLTQSRVLARTLATETATTTDAESRFVETAFAQILGRPPQAEELMQCRAFLAAQSNRFAAPATLTKFTSGEKVAVAPSADPAQRARENLIHVLLNHNEFVTIR